jgi:uncharacterized protein (DUF1330 family)
MSAYLIYLCQSVNDRNELETYWEKINDTLEGVDIKLLSAYAAQELLEGDGPVEGAVVAEFPSMDAARAWYNGAAYTEVRQHRLRGGKYIGLLVDGEFTVNVEDRMPQTVNNRPKADAEGQPTASVSMNPGQTLLTRIPLGAGSSDGASL